MIQTTLTLVRRIWQRIGIFGRPTRGLCQKYFSLQQFLEFSICCALGLAGNLQASDISTALWTGNPPPDYLKMSAVNPVTGRILTRYGGSVYVSDDHGSTWREASQGLQADPYANLNTVSARFFASRNGSFFMYTGSRGGSNGSLDGIFRLADKSFVWTKVAPGLPYYNMYPQSMGENSDGSIMVYAAIDSLYRSIDGGVTWIQTGATLPKDGWTPDGPTYSRVHSVVISAPNTFLFSIYDFKIYRTTDGAATFSAASGLPGSSPTQLLVDKRNGSRIYVGTFWDGVFYSEDGGQSWAPLQTGLPTGGVEDLAQASDGTVYARVSDQMGGQGIFRLRPGTQTWDNYCSDLSFPIRSACNSFGLDPDDNLYASFGTWGLKKRTANGSEWVDVNDGKAHGSPPYALGLSVDLAGRIYAGARTPTIGPGGGLGMFVSEDQGQSWAVSGNKIEDSDITSVASDDNGYTYASTYWFEVIRTTDGGRSWTNPSVFRFPSTPTQVIVDGGRLYAGSYWDGIFRSDDHAANWSNISAGLPPGRGVSSLTRLGDGRIICFVSDQTGTMGVYRSTLNGNGFEENHQGLSTDSVAVLRQGNYRTAGVGTGGGGVGYAWNTGGLYRQTTSTSDWVPISLPGGKNVRCVAPSPVGGTLVGTDGGGVFHRDENSGIWEKVGDARLDAAVVYALTLGPEGRTYAGSSIGVFSILPTSFIHTPPPVITSALTASVYVGVAYDYRIVASNSPTAYNAHGLPPGLSVNTATGVISGVPTATGTYLIEIVAANSYRTDTKILSLTVTVPPPPVISTTLSANASLRFPASLAITASNTPTSYNATGLPPGLTIDQSTGQISGAPTATGTYLVEIAAANWGGVTRAILTLTVTRAPQDSLLSGTQSDLLLENQATGERVVWQMSGATIADSANLPTFTAGWHFAGTGDFSGDGRADIVLQNTQSGERVIWQMNGSTITGSLGLPTLPVAWQFACVGDINNDGNPDILLQNTSTNDRIIWLMSGNSITSSVALPSLPADWQICGILDFSGDNQPDVLIQNTTTGERVIWVLNNQLAITQSLALPAFYAGWRFAGVGHYTLDNLPNIVLQNTLTGERVLWSINPNGTIASSTGLPTLPVEWSFAGPATNRAKPPVLSDLTGDGQSDILVTDTGSGTRIIWAMNGNDIASSIALPTLPAAWEFAGTADFNADGMNDILLQNMSTGERILWLMNSASIGGSVALPTLPVSWSFAAIADVNLDGQPDIVLQNTTTGERVIWVMDRAKIHVSLGLPTLPTSWQIAAGGGFTADGRANLLLENTASGDRLFWTLNPDGAIQQSVGLAVFLGGWRFAGTGDFNADGQPDIILQNPTTGERVIWQMNRTAIGSSLGLPVLPTGWTLRD